MSGNANAYRLLFFTLLIYVVALTIGSPLLFYLAYVFGGVLLAAYIWSRLNKRLLEIRRHVRPQQAQVGQTVEETIEISNHSRVLKLWLEVRDHSTLQGHYFGAVVTLPGRSTRRWNIRTRCYRRGLFRLGPTAVTTGDPFGLFQTSSYYTDDTELIVYPATVPLGSFGINSSELPGGSQTARRAHHSTPSAAGIRDYFPGDPMNRIHWAATARTQKLMVKEFELDPTADVWLVLDLNAAVHIADPSLARSQRPGVEWRPSRNNLASNLFGEQARAGAPGTAPKRDPIFIEPTTEEYSVTIAASLASYFISQGRSVGFVAWGQHRVVLPADRGARQLIKILRALAVLRAEGTAPFEQVLTAENRLFSRQDTVVAITPSLDDKWVAALEMQTYKGIQAVAVIIEPATFGGEGNSLMLVGTLSSIHVPTSLVKRDDALDIALGQQFGKAGVRHFR
jgi:uncharacterized protein (DUF58 family)